MGIALYQKVFFLLSRGTSWYSPDLPCSTWSDDYIMTLSTFDTLSKHWSLPYLTLLFVLFFLTCKAFRPCEYKKLSLNTFVRNPRFCRADHLDLEITRWVPLRKPRLPSLTWACSLFLKESSRFISLRGTSYISHAQCRGLLILKVVIPKKQRNGKGYLVTRTQTLFYLLLIQGVTR